MKPSLIVFDLDYTLWPFWVDTHVDPPFKKQSDGRVLDFHGRHVKYYRDVPQMLKQLQQEGYTLAVASRTSCTDEARQLLNLFDWNKYFTYKEIYPGSKVAHFQRFHEQSGLPYQKMLFFDGCFLCVTCIHAKDGMSLQVLQEGLQVFAEKSQGRKT
ncbi:magnesium-dependent phosphatase 1-like [Lingula anatina]|uniref:Magnesium-dependent phosphatase 1-like n=1 Tax=Lingula anatina TaxID=7574 RepID=A0A1S3J1U3_LINAN|nr:magnesium-dependent phosphatase 1-like [Lingula anatina]|eukprot:XP_013403794.1 magnesium-dependent phosphatase 1-like [Lingula anatina]